MPNFEGQISAPLPRPTQDELEKLISKHEQWLANPSNGTRLVLLGVDLVGLTLSGNLSQAIFRNCQLQGASFLNARLSQSDLMACDLTATLFENVIIGPGITQIHNCNLSRMRSNNLRATNGSLMGCAFTGAKLENTSFSSGFIKSCTFADSTLSQFSFAGVVIEDINLNRVDFGMDCSALKAQFYGGSALAIDFSKFTSLEDSSFIGTDFSDGVANDVDFGSNGLRAKSFQKSKFLNSHLSGAKLYDVDFGGVDFTNSDLTNTVIKGDLRGATFRHAKLHQAQLAWINVEACDFSHCQGAIETDNIRASRADFTQAQLSGSHLAYADLRGANFRGAELKHAILGGADLEGAVWTSGEICAAGSVGRCIIS